MSGLKMIVANSELSDKEREMKILWQICNSEFGLLSPTTFYLVDTSLHYCSTENEEAFMI